MVTIRIKGGLGNQLFQYAAGYSLARRLNQDMVLDTSFFSKQKLRGYKLGELNIKYSFISNEKRVPLTIRIVRDKYGNKAIRMLKKRIISAGKNRIILVEIGPGIMNEFFTVKCKNVFVDGYFQSEKHFVDCRRELLTQFKPKYAQDKDFYDELAQIRNTNSVAIHVRRGDFIKEQFNNNPRRYLLSEKYYYNALTYSDKRQVNPQYYWFSDDIEWVKKNFGVRSDFHFVSLRTEHPDIDEMMLMKNCNHIITANSTFSWWAAWLNEHDDPMILCPSKPYGIPEMIPNNWKKIQIN